VDGLVHISDMSWTKKVNHPGEILRKGDTIDVKVLDIDVEKRRISLGIKQLIEDPWGELASRFSVGTESECEVARILDRGMIMNLSETVEGFIPLNQLGQDINHPSEVYKVGDKVPAEVVEFDMEGRKIILSVVEYFNDKDKALWDEYEAGHVPKKAPKPEKVEIQPADSVEGEKPAEDAQPKEEEPAQ
jgi:small subunit ribosomal protein S1